MVVAELHSAFQCSTTVELSQWLRVLASSLDTRVPDFAMPMLKKKGGVTTDVRAVWG